jgi:hypothetical protein
MSYYDDINYKSKFEIDNRKLLFNYIETIPTNEARRKFKDDFISVYNNSKSSDIYEKCYLTNDEVKIFDFLYNDQKTFSNNYFEKEKQLNLETNTHDQNVELMVEFLERFYNGIISPETLKHFFEKSTY